MFAVTRVSFKLISIAQCFSVACLKYHNIEFIFLVLIVGLNCSLRLSLTSIEFLPPIYYDLKFDMETVFKQAIIT